MDQGMTFLAHWLRYHWFHLDGTPCPEYMAPSPKTAGGEYWWCTDHEKHVVYAEPSINTKPVA